MKWAEDIATLNGRFRCDGLLARGGFIDVHKRIQLRVQTCCAIEMMLDNFARRDGLESDSAGDFRERLIVKGRHEVTSSVRADHPSVKRGEDSWEFCQAAKFVDARQEGREN